MFKEFSNHEKEEDYLSEFRQKIAAQQQEDMERRRYELQRSRNSFVGTILGIVLAGVVSWFFLLPRFSDVSEKEIPVIRRPITPAKIQPNDPGGMEILNQDKSIYALIEKQEIKEPKVESLLPPPETPKLPTIVPQPEEKQVASADDFEEMSVSEIKETSPKALAANESKVAYDESLTRKIDEKIEAVQTNSTAQITIPEKLPEIKVEVKKAQPSATAPENQSVQAKNVSVSAKDDKPAVSKSAELSKASEVVPIQSQMHITKGVWQVQLMASNNKNALEKSWQNLKAKHSFLSNLPHEAEASQTDSLYRLKVGAFKTRAQADALCAQVKKTGGSCLVKQK